MTADELDAIVLPLMLYSALFTIAAVMMVDLQYVAAGWILVACVIAATLGAPGFAGLCLGSFLPMFARIIQPACVDLYRMYPD